MSKYQLRVVVFKEMGHFFPKFQVEEYVPRAQTICKRLTTLPLKIFTQRQFVEDFLRKKCSFIRRSLLRFERQRLWRA